MVCLCLAATIAARAADGPGASLDRGLAAHWRFDEGAGGVLHDTSGNGNHGNIAGAQWVKCGERHALLFDGVDDYVDCGVGAGLDLRGNLTMMAWIRAEPQRQSGEPGIIGKAYGSFVLTQYHGQVYTYVSGGGSNASATCPHARWVHLATTYDGAMLLLYVNGELAGERPVTGALRPGGHFWMARSDGELKWTRDAHFQGQITEVRVYDRVLTPEEIARHERATNPADTVAADVTPIPSRDSILVHLDRSGLEKAGRHSRRVDVKLRRTDPGGEVIGSVLQSTAVRTFDARHRAELSLPATGLEPGRYEVEVIARKRFGGSVGSPAVHRFEWEQPRRYPCGPTGAKRLNNLVTELLSVPGPDESGKEYTFLNPRRGWLFFANSGAERVQLRPQSGGATQEIILSDECGSAREAMRLLPQGRYGLSTDSVRQLIVRAIPELIYTDYNDEPQVTPCGPFRGAFQDTVLRNVNTVVGTADETSAQKWRARGKKWLVHCGVPAGTPDAPLTVGSAYDYITTHAGFQSDAFDGLIADEFGGSGPECTVWSEAVNKALSHTEYRGKAYYPYCGNLWNGDDGRGFARRVAELGCGVAWERYLKEQPAESDAWQCFQENLIYWAREYRRHCSPQLAGLVVCFGYLSAPPESLDAHPHVNYKTYLDMQFQLAAVHPAFEGLSGLMTYLARYADEETVRWGAALFRHYGIEGSTEMLGSDPYVLTHVENPDFDREGAGWTLRAANPGSITFERSPGFGWLQGRYPRGAEGNSVIVTSRSADGPNTFSQTIRGLEPGRLYSFRMFSGDFRDLSSRQVHSVSVRIDNADIIPGQSFAHMAANCYSHHFGPYDREHKAWMNYHWRVFRAREKTADLVIGDWETDTEPGGPTGQQLMFNFVQIQPYFEK